jgi:hypothetical protein
MTDQTQIATPEATSLELAHSALQILDQVGAGISKAGAIILMDTARQLREAAVSLEFQLSTEDKSRFETLRRVVEQRLLELESVVS